MPLPGPHAAALDAAPQQERRRAEDARRERRRAGASIASAPAAAPLAGSRRVASTPRRRAGLDADPLDAHRGAARARPRARRAAPTDERRLLRADRAAEVAEPEVRAAAHRARHRLGGPAESLRAELEEARVAVQVRGVGGRRVHRRARRARRRGRGRPRSSPRGRSRAARPRGSPRAAASRARRSPPSSRRRSARRRAPSRSRRAVAVVMRRASISRGSPLNSRVSTRGPGLEEQHVEARLGEPRRRGRAAGAASDHDDVRAEPLAHRPSERDHYARYTPAAMLRLALDTDPAWGAFAARATSPEVLLDHAHCEKKAAGAAVTLLFRYPQHAALQAPLAALAREELGHFEAVLAAARAARRRPSRASAPRPTPAGSTRACGPASPSGSSTSCSAARPSRRGAASALACCAGAVAERRAARALRRAPRGRGAPSPPLRRPRRGDLPARGRARAAAPRFSRTRRARCARPRPASRGSTPAPFRKGSGMEL